MAQLLAVLVVDVVVEDCGVWVCGWGRAGRGEERGERAGGRAVCLAAMLHADGPTPAPTHNPQPHTPALPPRTAPPRTAAASPVGVPGWVSM